MRFHSPRSARWLRVFVVGGVAAALALASGIAFATESGGTPQVSTNAPDPATANIDVNGYGTNSGGTGQLSQFTICFNKQIQTIAQSSTAGTAATNLLEHLRLDGYGGYGGNTTNPPPSGTSPGATTFGALNSSSSFPAPANGSNTTTGGTGPGTGTTKLTGITPSPDQTLQLGASFTAPNQGATGNWGVKSSDSKSYTYTGNAFSSSSNPDCVIVQLTAAASSPGLDLNQYSEVSVDEGAALGLGSNTQYTTPATLAFTTSSGTTEVTPRLGGSTGPKLLAGSSGGASNTLAYAFSEALDPGSITPGSFCYVSNSGTEYCGTSASVSGGNSVIVTFPGNINAAAYYEVYPGAVYSSATGVPDPGTAVGSTVASVPTLQSATPVAGTPGSFDLTYDQCVVANTTTNLVAVLQDNTMVNGGTTSTVGTNCRMIRVSFGSVKNMSLFASKVVKIVDLGGAVKGTSSGSGTSALGEGDATSPSWMTPGHTDGPDLVGFSVNTSQNAAYFYFDQQFGSLAGNANEPIATDFGLIYKDGTNSLDNGATGMTATFVGPNEVKVAYQPSTMGTSSNPVVAGTVGNADADEKTCPTAGHGGAGTGCDGSFAVQDYQNKGNISPLASGIGGTTTTTSSTNSTGTTTVTTTTSTPSGKGKIGLTSKKLKVKGGKVLIPLKCLTNVACIGKLSLTYKVTTIHHHRVTAVCTKSRFSSYHINAHKSKTVKLPLTKACLRALHRHHNHLSVKLTGKGLVKLVTLI